MYTTVDMRALQDRLDAITTPVAEEVAVETAAPETAPDVEQVELADGDVEFAEFKDMLGRTGGVMGFKN